MEENKKDFIKDGLDNASIIIAVKKIRKVIETNASISYDAKIENLKKEYSEFIERYPMLFDMASKNEPFDWNFFNYFMNMRNKIINNELTTDKASTIIGQNTFDKFIDKNEFNSNKKRKGNDD